MSEIEVYMHYAMVFGQRVNRPASMSVSQWYDYWASSGPCYRWDCNRR
jgi:hypothetical protein